MGTLPVAALILVISGCAQELEPENSAKSQIEVVVVDFFTQWGTKKFPFGRAYIEKEGSRFVFLHFDNNRKGETCADSVAKYKLMIACGYDGKRHWYAGFRDRERNQLLPIQRPKRLVEKQDLRNRPTTQESSKKYAARIRIVNRPSLTLMDYSPITELRHALDIKRLDSKQLLPALQKNKNVYSITRETNRRYSVQDEFWERFKHVEIWITDSTRYYLIQYDENEAFPIRRIRSRVKIRTNGPSPPTSVLPDTFDAIRCEKSSKIPESWFGHDFYRGTKTKVKKDN